MNNIAINKIDNYNETLENIAANVRLAVIAEKDDIYNQLADEANRSPSFMARVFPSEAERAQRHITAERVKYLAGQRHQLIDVYFKVKLEMARHEGETLVAATKTHLTTELTKFIAVKIDEMDKTIIGSREAMLAKLKPHIEAMEKYKDMPMLYDPAMRSIHKQIENYLDTMDQLLDNFRDNLTRKHQDNVRGGIKDVF